MTYRGMDRKTLDAAYDNIFSILEELARPGGAILGALHELAR